MRWIVQSHLHIDHTGALAVIEEFPNAEVLVTRTEHAWAHAPASFAQWGYCHADFVKPGIALVAAGGPRGRLRPVRRRQAWSAGGRPGHSPGHVSFEVHLPSGTALFLAIDAVNRLDELDGSHLPAFTSSLTEATASIARRSGAWRGARERTSWRATIRTSGHAAPRAGGLRMSGLAQLIDPDAQLELLADGFVFTEGPAWNPVERTLVFSDIPGDARYRWSEERGLRAPSRRRRSRATAWPTRPTGRLLVCEQVSSQLVRFTPDGHRDVVAFHHGGRYLNSPNDVVVSAKDGAIYFTDPNYGRWAGAFGWERTCDLDFQGVFRVPPGGGDAELVVEPGEFEQPNGLCFSPDESIMYVNDSPRTHVKAFDVAENGSLVGGRVLVDGIGTGETGKGSPDGMECDEHGNVWCSGAVAGSGSSRPTASTSASSASRRSAGASPGAGTT